MLSVGGNSSEINKLHRKTKQKTLAEEYNQTMELRVTKALKEEEGRAMAWWRASWVSHI